MSLTAEILQTWLNLEGDFLWPGYVNMLKSVKMRFRSTRHWLLEFLQNAEDAGATPSVS